MEGDGPPAGEALLQATHNVAWHAHEDCGIAAEVHEGELTCDRNLRISSGPQLMLREEKIADRSVSLIAKHCLQKTNLQ